MKRFFLLSIALIFLSFSSETCYAGCLSGNIYYSGGPVLGYWNTGIFNACGWSRTGGTSGICNIYLGGNVFDPNNYTTGTNGNYVSIVSCPLDAYIWLLILPIVSLGFHYMRRKSLVEIQE